MNMRRTLSLTLCAIFCLGLMSCETPDATPTPALDSAPVETTTNVEVPSATPTAATEAPTPTPTPTAEPDDRGIEGMDGFVFRMLLEGEPFNLPYGNDTPSSEETSEFFAASATSSSISDGISYDYSILLDNDDEIISGSVGISGIDVSSKTLKSAADLYFWVLLTCSSDKLSDDEDAVTALINDVLENATTDGYEFAVDDINFTAYSSGPESYWIDFAKAE